MSRSVGDPTDAFHIICTCHIHSPKGGSYGCNWFQVGGCTSPGHAYQWHLQGQVSDGTCVPWWISGCLNPIDFMQCGLIYRFMECLRRTVTLTAMYFFFQIKNKVLIKTIFTKPFSDGTSSVKLKLSGKPFPLPKPDMHGSLIHNIYAIGTGFCLMNIINFLAQWYLGYVLWTTNINIKHLIKIAIPFMGLVLK